MVCDASYARRHRFAHEWRTIGVGFTDCVVTLTTEISFRSVNCMLVEGYRHSGDLGGTIKAQVASYRVDNILEAGSSRTSAGRDRELGTTE